MFTSLVIILLLATIGTFGGARRQDEFKAKDLVEADWYDEQNRTGRITDDAYLDQDEDRWINITDSLISVVPLDLSPVPDIINEAIVNSSSPKNTINGSLANLDGILDMELIENQSLGLSGNHSDESVFQPHPRIILVRIRDHPQHGNASIGVGEQNPPPETISGLRG